MARNVYGPGVRMGNWNEDVYQEEERLRHFLEKREKGELLIQRNRRLKKHILRPLQLSVSEDGYVHYGDKVILVNPDHVLTEEAGVFMRGDLSLCMSPDEIKAQLNDDLEIPCGVTAVPTIAPIGRNTFTILSNNANSCNVGQVVVYGQDFCLGIPAGLEGKMANEKIVIYHRHTNRALAVHRNLSLRTYFGKEAEVAAHTHFDPHRVEKPKNHWMLVTGNPRNKSNTMLDISKPIAVDTRAVEQAMGINT